MYFNSKPIFNRKSKSAPRKKTPTSNLIKYVSLINFVCTYYSCMYMMCLHVQSQFPDIATCI